MSGRAIGTVVGAVIGFYVGGPQGAYYGAMIGGMAGGLIDPETLQGAQFSGRSIAGSESGLARAIIYGTAPCDGRLMDGEDAPRVTRADVGKGGPEVENDTALLSYAIEICESSELRGTSVQAVIAVWEDEKLVYDVREDSLVSPADNAKWIENKHFYYGEEGQSPSALLESIHGVGNVPAYVGTCRMDVEDEDLVLHGERIPRYRFLVSKCPAVIGNLLVTGASLTEGGPYFARARADAEPEFVGVPQSSGADMPNMVADYYGGIWIAVEGESRYSTNFGKTWQTGVVNPPLGYGARLVAGGSDGFLAQDGERTTGHGYAKAPLIPTDFTSFSFQRRVSPIEVDTINWLSMVRFEGGYYYADQDGSLMRSMTLVGGEWELIGGYRPDDICFYHDVAEFGGYLYATVTQIQDQFLPSEVRRYQLRRWDGTDWLTVLVSNLTGGLRPWHLAKNDEHLIVHCIGSEYVYTSADGFSEPHATGIVGDAPPSIDGRQIKASNGLVFILSATQVVSTKNGITFANPVPHGLADARSISSSEDDGIYTGIVIPDAPGYVVDPITGEVIGPARSVANACGMFLDEVVRSLYALGSQQLTDDEFDLDALAPYYVRGYSVADVGATSADAIEPLRRTYFFDLPEYDGKIHARLRGEPIDWVVDPDDIIPGEESTLEGKRGQETSYPKRLEFNYVALSLDYKPSMQPADDINPDTFTNQVESYQTNLVLEDDEAAKIADVMLKVMRTEREDEQKFSLPIQYVGIIATDLLSIEGRRYRVDQMRVERNRVVIERAVYDRASAYYSEAVGVEGIRPSPPVSSVRGPTASAVMNMPVLRDEDDRAGVYWAAAGYLPGFRGATLQMSRNGVDFEIGPEIPKSSTMGLLTADLPSASAYGQDNTNTLRVRMYPGGKDLDSTTYEGLIAEENVAAILYPNGTTEIIQFQTAIEVADREYELTGLMRGRMDTTPGLHLAEAQFVMLDEDVRFVAIRPDDLGRTLTFRAVSRGTNPEDNATQVITFNTIESLREWQPYNVTVESDGAGGFCTAWIGRGRLGSSLMPANSQWFEGYRVTFSFGGDTYEVDTSAQAVCVDAATMLAEFGVGYGAPQVSVRARSRVATNDDDFDSPPATPTNPEAGELFAASGTFPEWYRGVYCILFNDDFDLDITGGYWDAGATGDVMPGVGVYAKVPLGSWFQAMGFPTTAGAVTTDVTVYADSPVPGYGGNATITHGNTCLATPTYSPVDLRFRSRFGNKLLANADPGSAIQLVDGNPSFYSHGFTTGKRRAEFTIAGSTFAFWFGFNVGRGDDLTNGDNTIRVGYLMTDGAAAATTGDGTYWVEYDAATGAYAFGKVGGGSLGTGTVALPGGKLARFAISTDYAQNASIVCNFGIQAWIGTPSSGYGGVPYPISAIPVQWDVPAPSNAIMRLGDGLRGAYYGLRWSGTGYLMKGTVGKSSGQWQFAAAGGRVGICVASFVRSAGQLGDAGTADSVGWDGSTLRTCLSGVQSSIALPFLGAAIFALDADADELRVCRTNPDGTVAIAHVVTLPAGLTWFPAVTDGGSPQLTYDPAGLPGYSNWTMTL